mgnify:FL=1
MFLLAGCIESVVVLGGGATNGKIVQSSIQSAASYGMKKKTGRTPFGHALNYVKQNKTSEKKDSCSSFVNKRELEICLMVEKRITSKQAKIKNKEYSSNVSKKLTLSIQSSINDKYKIKYLDQ